MNNHITKWLPAYHDGELRGRRLAQVETHLENCDLCRGELRQLEALSGLFNDVPVVKTNIPADRFSAQVGLQLGRRTQPEVEPVSHQRWRWTALPVSLLIGIAFLQVVQWLASGLNLAQIFGYGEAALSRLTTTTPEPQGLLAQLSSDLIRVGIPFSPQVLLGLVIPAILAVGYLVWLILWGLNQREVEAIFNE